MFVRNFIFSYGSVRSKELFAVSERVVLPKCYFLVTVPCRKIWEQNWPNNFKCLQGLPSRVYRTAAWVDGVYLVSERVILPKRYFRIAVPCRKIWESNRANDVVIMHELSCWSKYTIVTNIVHSQNDRYM